MQYNKPTVYNTIIFLAQQLLLFSVVVYLALYYELLQLGPFAPKRILSFDVYKPDTLSVPQRITIIIIIVRLLESARMSKKLPWC